MGSSGDKRIAPAFPGYSTRPRNYGVEPAARRDRKQRWDCRLGPHQRGLCGVAGIGSPKRHPGSGCRPTGVEECHSAIPVHEVCDG